MEVFGYSFWEDKMNYQESLAYLEGCSSFGIKPGLERIEKLLAQLGNPEKSYKTIHVTGTNGKGSVTSYIESALYYSGLKVGRYTSPHLHDYTERIRINDHDISPEDMADVLTEVRLVSEKLIAEGLEAPTQFELLTAAAFLYFKKQGVQYAVIEVGLGGLLDSTNVIVPEVSVITNVTIDHQKYCGNTVADIAKHKAGIIKPGVPVVTAAQQVALDIIKETGKKMKSKVYCFGQDFTIESRTAMKKMQMITFSEHHQGKENQAMLVTSLAGLHQTVNLACATMAIRLLMEKEPAISEETMREGLARTTWPGRFEIVEYKDRTIILDGAHNAGGAEAFKMTYAELFKEEPKTLVMAILEDKEVDHVISEIVQPSDWVITVPAPTPRSMKPEELAKRMPCGTNVAYSVKEGLDMALARVPVGGIIVICGSLYILGEAQDWLKQ